MTVERIENIISHVLRIGVAVSLLVVAAGAIVSFVHHPAYLWSPKDLGTLTSPGALTMPSVSAVAAGVLAGRGEAVVMAGLLLLIATPVMRVAVSVAVFLAQRDRIFVAVTAVVLALLLVSFIIGAAG